MKERSAYSVLKKSGCMSSFRPGHLFVTLAFLCWFIPVSLISQDLPEYDEISVFLEIPRYLGSEIDAAIRGDELFLPVTDLFNLLKIKNTPSQDLESVEGFFILPEAEYRISRTDNLIEFQDKIFNLDPGDIIRTESNLYLKSTLYGKVFGLECVFNFRSLSVLVNSRLELPMIREMRLEEMRKNLSRLKGEPQADTIIGQTRPLFRFGMADWSVTSTQETEHASDTRINLSLGAMVAGGEATASLYYDSNDPFNEKQQYYHWRYVNNDFSPLRQIMAGKISAQSISSLFNPVVGIQLTNTPTTYRRSFGTYTLSDRTDPGWIVELYVNNILVDYVKADASGFFTFEVPLVYGNSMVMLKFYGPWGEERSREQNITIPFNFLPKNTFEYKVSGGIVEDTLGSKFGRAALGYGLTKNLTFGGGVEYLSSLSSQPFMPFLNASIRVTNNLLLTGEYVHGVRSKGTFTYRMPSNLQLDLNYTLYDKDQEAIFYNYLEERKATLSIPLRIGKFRTYQRASIYQIILPRSFKYTTGEWMLSGSLFGINTNLTTYALILKNADPYVYSNFSLALRLPGGFILMPQAQYSYTFNEMLTAKLRVEKRLFDHAYFNMSYEQNFRNDLRMGELGLRYDFSFAQTGLSVRQSNKRTSFVEYARGSIINDRKTKYMGTDNRTNVGRGGITITAFIDLNVNGTKDSGEPKAPGLNLRSSGGRVEKSERDTTIRILGLEPYAKYYIELDQNSFENISWRLPVNTLSVTVDPNMLKNIEIPVAVAGEATGTVYLEQDSVANGIGRIIVGFYTPDNKLAGRALTEFDGYYSYLGLVPGEYVVRPDTAQLRNLGMTSEPESMNFSINTGIDGDIVDGLDFLLKMTLPDTLPEIPAAVPEVPVSREIQKDTSYMILHELTEELYTITEDSWAIQIGAFKSRSLAQRFRRDLEKNLGKKVEITISGEYYRVRILDLPTRAEVDENVVKLNKLGFKELWIIRLLAKEQQRLLVTRDDSLAMIRERYGEKIDYVFIPDRAVQIGAFRQKSNALAMTGRISKLIDREVEVVEEDGFYKVRITGFDDLEEMQKFVPALDLLGIKEYWLTTAKILETAAPVVEEKPATLETDTLLRSAEKEPGLVSTEEKPLIVQSDTALIPLAEEPEIVMAEETAAPVPTVALQVAIFHNKNKALRAQRRITEKLGLPVEIVQQWDYYHVIVTGFFTREQTVRYFPELAGLGYPGITLIENYRSNK
jgi:cell division protein FtsN